MAASHTATILMPLIIKSIATGISSAPADMTHFLITALRAVVNLGHYCFLNRQFSSCDEPSLKRSASYPLIPSESFQLATTEGEHANRRNDNQALEAESSDAVLIMVFSPHRPRTAAHGGHAESVHGQQKGGVGFLSLKMLTSCGLFVVANVLSLILSLTQKRRRKIKPTEKVETLRPSFHVTPKLCNGGSPCNGVAVTSLPAPLTKRLLPAVFRDSPSEGSSEGSSHSDDPSFCGIATSCSRICDLLPPPKSRTEKRASRRRRPKPGCAVIDFLPAPKKEKSKLLQISTIEDIMKRSREQSSGTFGVNVALSGPV